MPVPGKVHEHFDLGVHPRVPDLEDERLPHHLAGGWRSAYQYSYAYAAQRPLLASVQLRVLENQGEQVKLRPRNHAFLLVNIQHYIRYVQRGPNTHGAACPADCYS